MSRPSPARVAAVDLGAGSTRVCSVDLEREPLSYEVVHRVAHEPRTGTGGVLRWDWTAIFEAVLEGLEMAASAGLASIGIDTWAVDYGLIDQRGDLICDPACYRDDRTRNFAEFVDRVGAGRLFAVNGLQCLPINTIFQLYSESRDLLSRTHRILTLPELVIHQLTGEITAETTSAGSTGLVDQTTGTWSTELVEALDLDATLFPEIQPPGTPVGAWRGIPVHLVAGHDTASAVVSIAAQETTPTFVSSGTWLLAGRELRTPLLSESARTAGLTNEYGPEGTTRLLKNIAGFWILEECRRLWGNPPIADLIAESLSAPASPERFDATDSRFLAPCDMVDEVRRAAGLPSCTSRGNIVNVIIHSLATSVARVLDELAEASQKQIEAVHLVGGGVRMKPFVEALRDRLPVRIHIGHAESAAIGNAMMQGIGLGKWRTLDEARRAV